MTTKLNSIVLADTDTTQLSYLVTSNPNPLQINSTGSITVVVYVAKPPAIQCTQLQFTVSIGPYDSDLTTDSTISTTCPTGWSLSSEAAGIFTFQPSGGSATIGPDGLTFEFNNITINDQVGGTPLKITETVTLNNQPQTNSTSFTLSKFPQAFNLESFTAQPTSIAPGDTVTLSWNGSSSDSNITYAYSLSYGSTNIPSLQSVGTYPVYGLQVSTEFTLNVEAGGNALCQKQVYVSVEQPTITQFGIVGDPDIIGASHTIELCWQTENVDHCALSLNGTPISGAISLPANSTSYSFTCPTGAFGESEFTLTAFSSKKNNAGIASSTFVNIASSITFPQYSRAGGGSLNASPDGSFLATSLDGISIISTATNQIVHTLHSQQRSQAAFNHDSTQVYYIVENYDPNNPYLTFVQSFDLTSGQTLSESPGASYVSLVKGSAQTSMIFASTGMSADSLEPSGFNVLNSSDLTLVHSVQFPSKFNSMVANPQGDQILICTGDFGGFYSYQLDTNTISPPLSTVVEPGEYADFAVFSPDGSHYCVVLENGGVLKVVDAVQNQVIGTMIPPVSILHGFLNDSCNPIVVAPDGINSFAILSDNTIAWIKLNTMEIFRSFSVGSNVVQYNYSSLAMNPAGTYLYITGLSSADNFPCLYTVQIPESN